MKKWLLLFLASTTLAACGTTQPNEVEESTSLSSEQVDAETITTTIVVAVDGEEIEDGNRTIEVEPGTVLLDLMKQEFDIEETDTFITSINGHEQDTEAGRYWLFNLNGEMAPVGAAELELEDGDVVDFNLTGL